MQDEVCVIWRVRLKDQERNNQQKKTNRSPKRKFLGRTSGVIRADVCGQKLRADPRALEKQAWRRIDGATGIGATALRGSERFWGL